MAELYLLPLFIFYTILFLLMYKEGFCNAFDHPDATLKNPSMTVARESIFVTN